MGWLAHKGLDFLSWWYDVPEGCECSQANPFFTFINQELTKIPVWDRKIPITPGYMLGLGSQAYWAYKSTPAQYVGTKTVERYFFRFKVSMWSWSEVRPTFRINIHRGWRVISGPTQGNYHFMPSGRFRTGPFTRTTYDMQIKPVFDKWNGFTASAVLAGVIDGIWQYLGDLANECLSLHQRYMRAFLAAMFGMGAGAAAALAFTAAIPFSPLVAIPVGFLVGYRFSTVFNRAKEKIFQSNPYHFGGG